MRVDAVSEQGRMYARQKNHLAKEILGSRVPCMARIILHAFPSPRAHVASLGYLVQISLSLHGLQWILLRGTA